MFTAEDARIMLKNNMSRIFDVIELQIRNNSNHFVFLDESFPYIGDRISKQQMKVLLDLGYSINKDIFIFNGKPYDAWKVSW